MSVFAVHASLREDDACPYCRHSQAEHEHDSACLCHVDGCDCNLGKVIEVLSKETGI